MQTSLSKFKKLFFAGLILLGMLPGIAQNIITVPFVDGFIGVQGSNPQTAQNVSNFSTLGVEVAYFQQNSSGAIFEVQGNDIVGTVILVSSVTGQTMDVPGAIVWRVTSMGSIEVIGFIPDPANPTTNLSDIGLAAYSIDANSNFGLRLNSSTFPIVDGSNISGNAATTGLLDALNAYLAEVQLNAPAGPVTADDLTTTSTTPTIGGTVTLAAGETFSVIVDGQTYDTSNGVTFDGSGNWQLTLPLTPFGTYTITAVITNASFYTLTDAGTLVINNCIDPDVPTITGDVVGICEGSTTTLIINGNLNDATQWSIYTGSCGGTLIGTTTTGSFDVGPVADTTYYIRGEGGCVTPGACATVTVTLDATTPISISNSVCEDEGLQWVTWDSVNAGQADGLLYGTVNTTMTHSANGLSTTPSMFNHAEFPAQYNVPNGTTLRNDLAGTFTVTLSEPITDLQVAFSSIGNPSTPVPINFSQPFEVIWANAAINVTSTTSLTGSEGFCILKFPGTFSTLSWDYLASETYMNLAFGANSFNCTDLNLCQGDSVTLTASGGTGSFEWSPSAGLSGTNTASVVASPTVTTTYTVIDPTNPCVDPRTIVVTVDDTAPTAVGQDITVELDASGNASIVAADVDNGSFDGCAVSTLSIDVTTFDCTNLGDNTVNLSATDSNGNSDSIAVTVTVEDNIAPTALCQDITIALDATGNATIAGADLDNGSTDNCGISSFAASTTSFTSSNIGTNSVTLTVTDSSGNTAVCTATVTVQDNIPPSAVCQNFTVALDATGNATILASNIDNGSTDNIGVTSLNLDISSFTCADLGDNTVTLTVGDAAGNESTCTATVTVVDNSDPTALGQDITVELDASGNASITTGDIDNGSSDNCGIVDQTLDISSFTCDDLGANAVLFTVEDSSGNQDGVTVTVTVEDNINPTAVCQDITIQLDASGNASIVAADIDNGSSDNCSVSSLAASTTAFTSADIGPNSVTLTVTDSSGNTAVCTAIVTVEDNIPPTAVCQNFTVALDATGNATITAANIDNGSSDNDSVASISLDVTSFTCADLGDNTVTLTVTDPSGNESTCTATVTVEDNINPTVNTQNITVALDATGNVTIVPADVDNGTTDNCSVTSLTLDITAFDCNDVGSNTVTLTAVDQSGNSASATAIVTVQDNIVPTVTTQNITVNLDGMGMATIVPADIDNGSTDNCTIDTYSLDIDSFDCEDVGANTVTLTVVDVNGNSSQATAVVTVVDVTPPVIVCAPDVVTIMDPGVCYAEVFFADAIALDECGIASVVQTAGPVSGSLFTQGVTTIEYTATDVNGNTTVCSFTITIQDTQIPTIASADDIAVSNDLGVCGAFVNVPAPTITDNCSQDPAPVVDGPVTPLLGGFQLLDTPSTVAGLSNSIGGDVTAVVTYNGDWSSGTEDFDLRGPDGSQVFFRDNQGVDCPGIDFADTFTISESTWNGWITTYGSDLTFTLLADTAVNPGLCANNFYQLSFTLGNGASLVNDYNGTADASDEYPVGTTVVTWNFTDIGGNVVTDTQTITVTDDEAPEMICIGEPGTFSITEDFEAGTLPNGWTNTALRGSDLWSFGSPFYVAGLGQAFPTNAVVFDDDAAGSGTDNAVELASPVYNMNGAASATLSFDYAYNYLSPNEFFSVEVYDGTQWVEILRLLEDHVPTNTGALDMLPYANDSFQVRFTYDDGGSGWKWGVGIDNFQLDYDIPSTPLTIALDANGAATLDVSQLLLSATDNCGPVSTSIGGGAVPGSLSTIFAGGNGGADGGVVYFDLTAINDLTLESLQMHVQDPGTFTVDIYAIEGGTYVGNENNAAPWTLIGTGSGESNTTGTPSDVTLDAALSLTAGTTYAMALVLDATHSHRYTNGDGTNESFSDANMSVSLGSATSVPFTGTIFNPRVFNGTFNYFVGTPPSTTVDFDCSNLGDNLIEVTAIDSAGNVSTCISTVEVVDVTDPILVCQDATVSLDENGMAEVLPEYFINTDASFDACGITITAVDVTDVTCADIGAPITVTVFVSDESGNIASCQATMTVVDDMGPLLVDCPEDMTVDPGAVDLFYELPDYTVGVTATDNCTDPVGVISQDPPAGTLLPDGVYTITLSATDNEGNVGSCSFELTVESVLGAASNQLSAGVEIYPNPARKVMNIGNSSNIQLERALIYDLNGRLIQSIDLGNMDREASVNVANLASGVYLVQLEAEGATAIKRLIKE